MRQTGAKLYYNRRILLISIAVLDMTPLQLEEVIF